uniref:Protein dispatched n=1 Tax=Cacopsylla melanoneura TaxID=428564 RepID=A0A8D8X106_9HEMI
MLYRFSRFISKRPLIGLLTCIVTALIFSIIPSILFHFPDFRDPKMGFEARGTELAKRLSAWNLLLEATRPSGPLTSNPDDETSVNIMNNGQVKQYRSSFLGYNKNKTKEQKEQPIIPLDQDELDNTTPLPTEEVPYQEDDGFGSHHKEVNWTAIMELGRDDNKGGGKRKNGKHKNRIYADENGDEEENKNQDKQSSSTWRRQHESYFCGPPSIDYSHVVISSTNGSDLLSLSSIMATCQIQEYLTSPKEYKSLCQTKGDREFTECCPIWSLPNYIAQLNKKKTCFDITEQDIRQTKKLLETCAFDFAAKKDEYLDCEVDSLYPCQQNCTVYNILHFITEKNYLFPPKEKPQLRNAIVFLPLAKSSALLDYYKNIISVGKLEKNHVTITAIDFGLKEILFDDLLLHDTWLIAAGAGSIVLFIYLYTSSLFLTGIIILTISQSLGVSYFFYTCVFNIQFFPFMNILAIIVALGIGSDDAFIVFNTWYNASKETTNVSSIDLYYTVLKHASIAICVTCVTTVAAFLTSIDSKITAVACFSIFASTTVVVNFVLMLLMLPSAIVLSERMRSISVFNIESLLSGYVDTFLSLFTEAVFRLKYFWLIILSVITAMSAVIVLYNPTLKLPDTAEFQLFTSDHLFEQYDFKYKNMFFFETFEMPEGQLQDYAYKMPLRFVFGIIPEDNGDRLNPASNGELVLDPKFDIASDKAQVWLKNFCKRVRAQPFYQSTQGPMLSNCFIEPFVEWMKVKCIDPVDQQKKFPCCEKYGFPYPKKVFNTCSVRFTNSLYKTPSSFFTRGITGPKFSKVHNDPQKDKREKPKVRAIVVEYDSNVSYTSSYIKIRNFYSQVESWFHEELKTAPASLKNGFFLSELNFYDLQDALQKDTINSIIVSIIVALIVLMFSLMNPVLAIMAIVTISSIIFVSIATLVLLGWKLNVLESVAICLVIGLSVDYSLHYVHNYKMAPDKSSRKNRVEYAIKMMSGPSLMAGLTTATTGAFMLPSSVLGYVQIGTFLIIMISVSWIYANFFLLPLLLVIGPVHGWAQFHYPDWLCSTFSCSYGGDDKTRIESETTSVTNERNSDMRESRELDTISGKRVSPPLSTRNQSPASVETEAGI